MRPFFSIVLPCYNSAKFIDRCIDSIKKQTFKNYEVIIIDNSSADGTYEKIREIKDSRFRIYTIKNNGILAKSRNLGIKKSKSNWIAFLDSDDWWKCNKLEYCYKKINKNVDFIYHDLILKSETFKLFYKKKINSRILKKPILLDLLTNGNAIANSSVVVRRKLLNKIGGISECKFLPAAEDYNTWLRISQITENFLYLPKSLGFYFLQENSMSSKNMSVPGKYAVREFFQILNKKEKMFVKSNLRYLSARYNHKNSRIKKAIEDFVFVIKYGKYNLKFKSLIKIILIYLKLKIF